MKLIQDSQESQNVGTL